MNRHQLLVKALKILAPNIVWNLEGENIIWLSEGDKPTDAEIDAEIIRLQAEYDSLAYSRARAESYPSYAEQFDLLYHSGLEGLKAELKKTKDKYPKG